MSGRHRRSSVRKSTARRNRVARSETLEPRTLLSGVGVVHSAPPTVAHPIGVIGGTTVTGSTAALSVLGSDAAGAGQLVYNWSVSSAPAGGAATFRANATYAAQNTVLSFN
jgi:hypothetical protein